MTRKLSFIISENSQQQQSSEQLNNTSDIKMQQQQTNRLITTFEELSHLKARSRLPIDIKSVPLSLLNKRSDSILLNDLNESSSASNILLKSRKYFSFMTTNKQFIDLKRNDHNNELKLKIINNQLVNDLNEITETTNSKQLKHCFSSSSSTTSSSSSSTDYDYANLILDSGCGSSISTLDNSSSTNITTNNNENLLIKKKTKILTVLFDYETESKNFNEKLIKFQVKKGQTVKVIRDYDDKYYLVATCSDNRIGFIPKEYIVDLNELKQRYKDSILSNSNNSNTNEHLNINYIEEKFKKLTHL